MTRKVVGVALNGNVACLRLCLDSQLGRRPESPKCWRRASRSGCTADRQKNGADYRFAAMDWRAKHLKLAKWFNSTAETPAMKATGPPAA